MIDKILKNITIINFDNTYVGDIYISDGKILKIIKKNKKPNTNSFLMPGFIDIHTHGGYGFSFNDLSSNIQKNQIYKYFNFLFKEGVTSVYATSVTCSLKDLENIYKNILIVNKDPISPIIGWHVEGPFISSIKAGAQDPKYIIPLNSINVRRINHFNKIRKIITLAPEVKQNSNYIKKLLKNTTISLGHTNANAKQTKTAIHLGATHLTHFYNSMPKYDHRNPSIINEAFINKNCLCELICDLVHVESTAILDTYKILGADRIILITDSLSCKGQPNGNYMLGQLPIVKHDKIATLKDGSSIAGSIQPYIMQLRNFYEVTKCSLNDLVKISSYNAAKSLNLLNKYGYIKKNNIANFVILDKKLNIKNVYFNGEEINNATN